MSKARTFLASYRIGGHSYVFEFKADTHLDAAKHLAAIRHNATLDGELALRIPVPGILERIVRWLNP